MIATASSSAPAAHSHLWYDAATVICLALAVLVVLFCIYWAVKIWEQLRIIAHYRREERRQRDAGLHQHQDKKKS
jgi:uncharacterized membrane protein